MDGATMAMLTTSVSGFALGAAGLLQSRRRDTAAAESTATDVATRVTEKGLAVLEAALARSVAEVADLTEDVAKLKVAVARCEAEKLDLRGQVRELLHTIEEGRA